MIISESRRRRLAHHSYAPAGEDTSVQLELKGVGVQTDSGGQAFMGRPLRARLERASEREQ